MTIFEHLRHHRIAASDGIDHERTSRAVVALATGGTPPDGTERPVHVCRTDQAPACRLPANHPASDGTVDLLTGRASAAAIATGSPAALSVDEVRRVERTLLLAMSSEASLPSLRCLAAVAGVTRARLRRAIGSVELAAQAIVDERFTIARSCTEMPTGWHPSLEVLGGRIVTHRLFVYSIVLDVVDSAAHSAATAAEFEDLERSLGDELRYQVRRWNVFDDDTTDRFVRDVAEIFAFRRIRSIDHASREQLERRLNHELAVVFARYEAVQRWNESRHAWFATAPSEPMRLAPALEPSHLPSAAVG